jgi:hypothetical protein
MNAIYFSYSRFWKNLSKYLILGISALVISSLILANSYPSLLKKGPIQAFAQDFYDAPQTGLNDDQWEDTDTTFYGTDSAPSSNWWEDSSSSAGSGTPATSTYEPFQVDYGYPQTGVNDDQWENTSTTFFGTDFEPSTPWWNDPAYTETTFYGTDTPSASSWWESFAPSQPASTGCNCGLPPVSTQSVPPPDFTTFAPTPNFPQANPIPNMTPSFPTTTTISPPNLPNIQPPSFNNARTFSGNNLVSPFGYFSPTTTTTTDNSRVTDNSRFNSSSSYKSTTKIDSHDRYDSHNISGSFNDRHDLTDSFNRLTGDANTTIVDSHNLSDSRIFDNSQTGFNTSISDSRDQSDNRGFNNSFNGPTGIDPTFLQSNAYQLQNTRSITYQDAPQPVITQEPVITQVELPSRNGGLLQSTRSISRSVTTAPTPTYRTTQIVQQPVLTTTTVPNRVVTSQSAPTCPANTNESEDENGDTVCIVDESKDSISAGTTTVQIQHRSTT